MAEVRVNARRAPLLQSVDVLATLVQRLDQMGQRDNTMLTAVNVNGRKVELDGPELSRFKLLPGDLVECKMETPVQLAFESLRVAQDMAELLVFDLKVATIHLWENSRYQEKSLETLLSDCQLFLLLGARPIELLGRDPHDLPHAAEGCLRQLDAVAGHLEDATLLAVNAKAREACHVLVGRVLPTVERWLGLTAAFAEHLEIDEAGASPILEGLRPAALPGA